MKRFHRSLLILGLASTPLLALTPPHASALYTPGQYNYTDNLGYRYNNPMSASLGTYLNESAKALFVRQSLQNAIIRSGPASSAADNAQRQRGQEVIRRNQATMTFPMREFPLSKWLNTWGGTDPHKRDQAAKEWVIQKALWAEEMQARGAKAGDMTDALALAFVTCMEAYNGERITNAGFQYLRGEFRKEGMKDPLYQGRSVESKQDLYEESMLTASDALMWRRQAQKSGDRSTIVQAQRSAARFLDRWWDTKTPGAIKELAAYRAPGASGAPAAPTPSNRTVITSSAPASTLAERPIEAVSFEEAKRTTNFTPVAPILIDQKFAATAKDEKMRDFVVKLSRQMVEQTRDDMRRNASANLPVDNVARAMASSLTACYMVVIARPGRQVGQDAPAFTREQMEGLRRQIALVLASKPEFKKMSDRDKQELSEFYLLLPALSSTLYNAGAAKNDAKAQEEARHIARAGFLGILGVEPEKVRFTDSGVTL